MNALLARNHDNRTRTRDAARIRALEILLGHRGVIDSMTDEQLRSLSEMPPGPPLEIGLPPR